MLARAIVLPTLVLGAHVKYSIAECADFSLTGSDGSIIKSGDIYFSKGFPDSYDTNAAGVIAYGGAASEPVCISFTNFDLDSNGSLEFSADGTNPLYVFSGTALPKPFTFTPDAGSIDIVNFVTQDAPTGTGFRFTCTDGACPCETEGPLSAAFDQTGDVITANGLSGTITGNPDRCLVLSDVDLQDGTLEYDGITYTSADKPPGPFSVTSPNPADLVFTAGTSGQEGSFTVTCVPGACTPEELSPCIVTNVVSGSLDQTDQVIESDSYNSGTGYDQGDEGIIQVTGPACLTFLDPFGLPNAILNYQGFNYTGLNTPGSISVQSGEFPFLKFLALADGFPGFRMLCNFGTCDAPTTTSAPTTSTSTTSTTSAPSSTTTATTTQTTVVPFPVSSCTKKSCRTLVKQKKQRLYDAAGCGDSTSCKNTVKATMPYNGNKKKACKPKTRQDVCQNIYWYT